MLDLKVVPFLCIPSGHINNVFCISGGYKAIYSFCHATTTPTDFSRLHFHATRVGLLGHFERNIEGLPAVLFFNASLPVT